MRIHGSYKIEQNGQTLYTTLLGTWNAECAEKFAKEIKETIQTMHEKPWIEISDLSEWGYCTPDADIFLQKLLHWRFTCNLKRHIVIQPNAIVEKMMKELDELGKIIICQSMQEAHKHLEEPDHTITTH